MSSWSYASLVADEPTVVRALDETVQSVAAMSEQARGAVTAQERAAWLAALRHVVAVTESAFTQVLERFDAHGDGEVLAAASTTSWCRQQLHLSSGDASSRVQLARSSGVLAEPLEHLREGALSLEHLRAVSESVRPLDTLRGHQERGVEILTELAVATDPQTVRAAGRRLRDAVEPDGVLPTRDQQHERRFLNLSPLLDGMTAVDGLLDAEATATVSAALAPLLVPTSKEDTRTTAQRRADALVEIATLAARTGDLPQLSGTAATLDVVIDLRTLLGDAAATTPPTRGPSTERSARWWRRLGELVGDPLRGLSGPASGGLVLDHPGGEASLSVETVRRLCCDASVGRILLGPGSVPLDLGRRERLFTGQQRRALLLRDGGCRFPGCTRPPRYTDSHHLVPWYDGGCTDLTNGLLLCRWHHNAVHVTSDGNTWTIEPEDPRQGAHGRLRFIGPSGQVLASDPRAP